MQKMGTLSLDGLIKSMYGAARTQFERWWSATNKDMSEVVSMVQIKIEPLSESALRWIQGKTHERSTIVSAVCMTELWFALAGDAVLVDADGMTCVEDGRVFLADERRGQCGEIEFLRLTVRIMASGCDNDGLREVVTSSLMAAQVYLLRSEAQSRCCLCE